MKCPRCDGDRPRIVAVEQYDTFVRRRRKCRICGYQWHTVERNEVPNDGV